MNDYFKHHIEALHYTKSIVPQMRQIVEPLLKNTHINSFGYLKFFRDGSVLNLATEDKWLQYRFDQKIKYKILFKEELVGTKRNKPYIYLWPDNQNDKLLMALRQYDMCNGSNIYIADSNSIEVFSFSTSAKHENMKNFYINNIELLQRIIIHFKEAARNFITHSSPGTIQTDVVFPDLNLDHSTEDHSPEVVDVPKRVHITNEVYLTQKELECCFYLMRGDSIKIIARKMNLSSRTVESYINNAKLRANCYSKNDLISFVSEKKWVLDSFFSI